MFLPFIKPEYKTVGYVLCTHYHIYLFQLNDIATLITDRTPKSTPILDVFFISYTLNLSLLPVHQLLAGPGSPPSTIQYLESPIHPSAVAEEETR
jgi:hypothetical protein